MLRAFRAPLTGCALALAALLPIGVAAQVRCTQQVLDVRGQPVTLSYCIDGPVSTNAFNELIVPVYETFHTGNAAFTRRRELHFLPGERMSRVVENLALERLGMSGVLHLTLIYAGNAVTVQGAMLSPGGITVK